jgi:hypothetical protein
MRKRSSVARAGKEDTMNKKIVSIRTLGRLNCTWTATGDPKAPLACIWLDNITPRSLTSTSSEDDMETDLRRCA